MSAPPDGGKPRARAHDGRRAEQSRDWLPPAAEPWRRRAGVQTAFSRAMLAAVHQYVDERVADRARRGERAGMKPVPPHGSAAAERAVDRPRDADGEAPHPAAQSPRIIGFDDEMEMVVLDREMNDPEVPAGGHVERAADSGKRAVGPQAANCGSAAQGHVHRVRRRVRRPWPVRDARPAARCKLAAGASSPASPRARRR